jgi:hypothetical protein
MKNMLKAPERTDRSLGENQHVVQTVLVVVVVSVLFGGVSREIYSYSQSLTIRDALLVRMISSSSYAAVVVDDVV